MACSTAKAVEWDATWSKNLDPSGRAAIGVHNSAYKNHPPPAVATANIIENVPRMMEVATPELTIRG